MRTILFKRRNESGHALLLVMGFLVIGLLVLAGTMQWASNNALLIERNNNYFSAAAAAEAATEKAMSQIMSDYNEAGAARVAARLDHYRQSVPEASEHPAFGQYLFSDTHGSAGRVGISQLDTWQVTPLISQYQGLSGFASTFRVAADARPTVAQHALGAAVQQDVQLATIPIFQFAIFYNIDLEINPGPDMTVAGRVHSNRELYAQPQATLTFNGNVTAAGSIIHDKSPLDPLGRTPGRIVYNGRHDGGVNSLNLPIGTDNTPENVRQIVEVPPSGEVATSEMGRQRFYNKADLVVTVYDDRVEARGGLPNGGTPSFAWSDVSSFVRTNVSFFNKRESKTVQATEIDVAALRSWNAAGNALKTGLGRDINSVYVNDLRSQSGSTQPGVRLVNGQELPPGGLTVATPQPLYVKGHYNAPTSALGTSNTTQTKPAALISDAITILSGSWADSASSSSLASRRAADTTVNAAILSGIVPSSSASYSGGVENFTRFLEDWGSRVLTYNGSMIVMYPSQKATGTWKGTGSTLGIYNPPTRRWNFDQNFLDPTKLPPGTPAVRTLIRGRWDLVAAGPAAH